jgi:hypothetical protein
MCRILKAALENSARRKDYIAYFLRLVQILFSNFPDASQAKLQFNLQISRIALSWSLDPCHR